ncbi:hypothetical protein F5051DRAFT_455229 [Lentinula edodes]|nr:hypothetical protein F5051DRAFT_455229 [Lentinula edodes]
MEVQGQVGIMRIILSPSDSPLKVAFGGKATAEITKRSSFKAFKNSFFFSQFLSLSKHSAGRCIQIQHTFFYVETSMQSRLSGMSLYLKICFIVILFVAHVVALPVSRSELVHRADQAGPVKEPPGPFLGDRRSAWTIMIVFFFPSNVTPEVESILGFREGVAAHIRNRIIDDTGITPFCQISALSQLSSLLPSGMSYEGDVSLRLTWFGPNHVFESRGKITAKGGISEVTAMNVEFSFPASNAARWIRKPGVPEKVTLTVPLHHLESRKLKDVLKLDEGGRMFEMLYVVHVVSGFCKVTLLNSCIVFSR